MIWQLVIWNPLSDSFTNSEFKRRGKPGAKFHRKMSQSEPAPGRGSNHRSLHTALFLHQTQKHARLADGQIGISLDRDSSSECSLLTASSRDRASSPRWSPNRCLALRPVRSEKTYSPLTLVCHLTAESKSPSLDMGRGQRAEERKNPIFPTGSAHAARRSRLDHLIAVAIPDIAKH